MNATNGGTSQSAVRSGPAIAMFFGTISPITMCATTTTTSEIVNATGASTAMGSPSQREGPLDEVGDRGLTEATQQQGADRDAELGRGQHAGEVGARPQHRRGAGGARVGHRLQPVAPCRDQRELRADEERVGQQQEDGGAEGEEVATHRRPPARAR